MSNAEGRLAEGQNLQTKAVSLEFTIDERLVVTGEDGSFDMGLADVRVSDRLANIARFLYLPDGRVIETLDNDAVDRALAQARRGKLAALIHFLESHAGAVAAATVLLVLVVAATVHYGVPILSRNVAMKVSPALEKKIGQSAMVALAGQFRPTHLTPGEQAVVRAQLRRLLPTEARSQLPTLEFRFTGGTIPNAFALPGGTILVTDELVNLATNDEMAAVLAHEIGHLRKRHGLQTLLNHSLALLFVTSLTGDLSTLTSFAGALPLTVVANGYSRDYEREADAFARDLMLARGIPLDCFPAVLDKIAEKVGKQGGLSYLSTHPSNDERHTLFKKPGGPTK